MTTLEAIDKSINHWEKNLKALKKANWVGKDSGHSRRWVNKRGDIIASFDSSDCALCLFFDDCEYGDERCSLAEYGYGCDEDTNPKSPWLQCLEAAGKKAIVKAADNMLKALRDTRERFIADNS